MGKIDMKDTRLSDSLSFNWKNGIREEYLTPITEEIR